MATTSSGLPKVYKIIVFRITSVWKMVLISTKQKGSQFLTVHLVHLLVAPSFNNCEPFLEISTISFENVETRASTHLPWQQDAD